MVFDLECQRCGLWFNTVDGLEQHDCGGECPGITCHTCQDDVETEIAQARREGEVEALEWVKKRVLEMRCERDTTWDRTLLAVVDEIDARLAELEK